MQGLIVYEARILLLQLILWFGLNRLQELMILRKVAIP